MYIKFFKRFIDIVLSFIGLIVLSPLFLFLAIVIKIDSKGSVFFRQKRVGINKTYFNIIKFRTMRANTSSDIPTHLFVNSEQYITKIGKFLRISSLDEVSQLINIFLGHMSFIGPRPALWNQTDLIQERDKYGANEVKPGLTGWAQINGRDELEIETKARLDGEYVCKIGFAIDVKCFFGTIVNVVTRKGIIEGGIKSEKNTYYRG